MLNETQLQQRLHGFEPLADEGDATWRSPSEWSRLWWLLAASEVVGERRWKGLVRLIYLKTAYGEIDGRMQSVRHGPERAFKGDLQGFADVLEPLLLNERRGTRYWAVRELGILRMRSSLEPLIAAAAEDDRRIRKEAIDSLHMLSQRHPEAGEALALMNQE